MTIDGNTQVRSKFDPSAPSDIITVPLQFDSNYRINTCLIYALTCSMVDKQLNSLSLIIACSIV